jgi:acid phosphatase type 7
MGMIKNNKTILMCTGVAVMAAVVLFGAAGPASTAISANDNDPILIGAGDIAKCDSPGDEATAALIAPKLKNPLVTVFTLGDNVYEYGTTEEWRRCYGPSWGKFRDRTRPSIGNHDAYSNNGAGYYQYFGAVAGPAGLGYYSYDVGRWHIVVVNSNQPPQPGDAQYTWLEADLRRQTSLCQLVMWHHPRFSSGIHGNDQRFRRLWRLLMQYKVDVVANAHDHHYERFAPQDEFAYANPRGPRAFVVGTGGAWLYSQKTTRPNSEARIFGVWGVMQFTLHPTAYSWEFLPVSGGVSDSGTAACF